MLRTRSAVSLEIGGGGFAPDPLFPGRFSLAKDLDKSRKPLSTIDQKIQGV